MMNKAQLEAIREALIQLETDYNIKVNGNTTEYEEDVLLPVRFKTIQTAFAALASLEAEQQMYEGSARMVTLYREDILHLFDEELANDLQDHDIEYIAGKLHDSIMYDFDLGEALAERISFSYPEFYKSYLTRKDGDDEMD